MELSPGTVHRDPNGNFNQYIHNRIFPLWRIAAMKISRLTDPKGMFNMECEKKLEGKSDSDLWNKRIDSANRRIFSPGQLSLFFFPSLCLFFSLLYFFSSPPVTSVPMTFEAKTLCACSLIGAYKTTLNKHSGHRGNVTSRASAMPYRFPSSRLPIDRMSRCPERESSVPYPSFLRDVSFQLARKLLFDSCRESSIASFSPSR